MTIDNKKFYLRPIDEELKLNIFSFIVEKVDERARWYKTLQRLTGNNFVNGQYNLNRALSATMEDHMNFSTEPINLSTLNDISHFLNDQNSKLEK